MASPADFRDGFSAGHSQFTASATEQQIDFWFSQPECVSRAAKLKFDFLEIETRIMLYLSLFALCFLSFFSSFMLRLIHAYYPAVAFLPLTKCHSALTAVVLRASGRLAARRRRAIPSMVTLPLSCGICSSPSPYPVLFSSMGRFESMSPSTTGLPCLCSSHPASISEFKIGEP